MKLSEAQDIFPDAIEWNFVGQASFSKYATLSGTDIKAEEDDSFFEANDCLFFYSSNLKYDNLWRWEPDALRWFEVFVPLSQ